MSGVVTFGDTALQFTPGDGERLAAAREARIQTRGIESGAAAAATAIDAEGTWVSKLPDSVLGRRVVGQLHQHGVRTEIAWVDPEEVRQSLVFRESGHPPRGETVRYDCEGTAVAETKPGDLPMDLIQRSATVFTGLSTAVLSEEVATTTEAMLRASRGSDVTTAVALDYREGFRSPDRYRETLTGLVDHVDTLIAQRRHAETVFGASGQPHELAHSLAAEFDIETVVVTRRDCSAVALQDTPGTNVVHDQDSLGVDAVDTTGRQAAFAGVLLGRLAEGTPIQEALVDAVAAATLACTVPGPLLSATSEELSDVTSAMNAAN